MQYEVISIKTVQTEKEGQLSFFEGEHNFPFPIKRIYYIHHVPSGARRGAHAHKTLQQMLFCPYGSVTIFLNNGETDKTDRKARFHEHFVPSGLPGLQWFVSFSVAQRFL